MNLSLNFEAAIEQQRHLERVSSRIGHAVLAFCRERVGSTFRAQELRDYVVSQSLAAPASPDRILRDLRKKQVLDYVEESRRGSIYRVTWCF